MRNAGQGFVAVQPSSCSLSSTMPPENKKRWQTCIALLCSVTDIRMIRLGSETRWVVGHSSQATIQQHWTALHWRAEHCACSHLCLGSLEWPLTSAASERMTLVATKPAMR